MPNPSRKFTFETERRKCEALYFQACRGNLLAEPLPTKGCVPEWPNGADCKSAVFRLRWFESIRTHILSAEVFSEESESSLSQLDEAKTCARFRPLRPKSCGNSSVDRALAFQAGGRGFESRFPLKHAYILV